MSKVVIALAAALCIAAAAPAPPVTTAAAPPFEIREPLRLAYDTRAEWLAFVRELPDGDAAARRYDTLVSDADYSRYQSGRTVTASRIGYRSDGLLIRGIMVAPPSPGPHPVILYAHGGVARWGRIIVPEVLEFHRLAERGYIVLATAYRGEMGSEGKPSFGEGDIADVLALLKLVDRLPGADPQRVGLWGFSRGGMVSYGVLARTTRLKAAAIVGGPTDLVTAPRRAEFDRFVYPDVIAGYARDQEGALARRSAIRWPERLAPTPILLLQGGDDPRVAPDEALRMAQALQGLKRSYRLKVYEGGGHDLLADMADARGELDRWFDTYVRDGKAAPANGVTALPASETDAE
ncbi:alpha/beta hydrolase family protein [Sphingomonas sp.]|uniref:alpha/beta hydrolase family protein n=1 Tax=Sphingomonas sp. TaxID=28214 RepID=UPI0035C84F5E